MTLAIVQGNPATCRWLGLTNNACCAMTWRLGLTSARHATKTSKWIWIMLNFNGLISFVSLPVRAWAVAGGGLPTNGIQI